MAENDASHQKPDREGALAAARTLYPSAGDQRLEEVLWAHTSYPFGDITLWKTQLAEQYANARTVFNPDGSPAPVDH